MTAIALSGVIGGPISGWIVQNLAGANGWSGWQWLFLCEGLPSIVIGCFVVFYLDDRIQHAKWLSDPEKALLARRISEDESGKTESPIGAVLGSPRVWLMSLIYFSFVMGLYGVSFWLPTIIKEIGVKSVFEIGLLTAIPWGFAAIAMVMLSKHSDERGERRWHIAVPAWSSP
jgi:MFS family permease